VARKVEEWIGRGDDTPVPERVLERLWKACGGKCEGCGLDLSDQAWDADHKVALINWIATPEAPHGNRESNLQVLGLKCCHRPKTKEDMKLKWRTSRKVRSHTGIKRRSTRYVVPGSKRSPFKKCVNGDVVDRKTGKVIKRGRA
jgi:hypothetical protein